MLKWIYGKDEPPGAATIILFKWRNSLYIGEVLGDRVWTNDFPTDTAREQGVSVNEIKWRPLGDVNDLFEG